MAHDPISELSDRLFNAWQAGEKIIREGGAAPDHAALIRDAEKLLSTQAPRAEVNWVSALVWLGQLHAMARQFDDAIRVYRQLVDLTYNSAYRQYSDYYEAHLGLNAFLEMGGKKQEALQECGKLVEHFEKMIHEHPDTAGNLTYNAASVYIDAKLQQARLQSALKNPAASIKILGDLAKLEGKLLGLQPQQTCGVIASQALAYLAAGDRPKAQEVALSAMTKAKDLFPKNDPNLSYLRDFLKELL